MAKYEDLSPQDKAAMEAWRSGARGQDVMNAWNTGSYTPKTQIPESRSFDQPEQQQQQDTNPINKFNLAVLDLLKKAQGMEHDTGAVKTEYEKEAFEAENAPLEGNLANLSPEQQWSVRSARGGVYDKSLQFVDTKLKQIRDVNSMLKETYNEDWSKLVPPSEKEIEAMRIALRAGRNLTADELKRYGKNFTEDDWNMWAEQNKKGQSAGTPVVITNPDTGEQYLFDKGTNTSTPVQYQQNNNIPQTPLNNAVLNAANKVTNSLPAGARQQWAKDINSQLAKGNVPEAINLLEGSVENSFDADTRKNYIGRKASATQLLSIAEEIKKLQARGLPTNIFVGNIDNLLGKLGKSIDPEVAKIRTRLESAQYEYRRAMTGVQFGEREADSYRKLFPGYEKNVPVNIAKIEGLIDSFTLHNSVLLENAIGTDNYNQIFKKVIDGVVYIRTRGGWIEQ